MNMSGLRLRDPSVRPGAAELLTGVEHSRVSDSAWNVPYLFCNYPNRRKTSCSTRKLSDPVVVGHQQYLTRTFHVTLSPGLYKGGQGPPRNIDNNTSTYKAIQATT